MFVNCSKQRSLVIPGPIHVIIRVPEMLPYNVWFPVDTRNLDEAIQAAAVEHVAYCIKHYDLLDKHLDIFPLNVVIEEMT